MLKVMVEGYHPESEYLLTGRFYGQCPEIDGRVILNDYAKVDEFSTFYQMKIEDIADYDLIGKVVSKEKATTNPLVVI